MQSQRNQWHYQPVTYPNLKDYPECFLVFMADLQGNDETKQAEISELELKQPTENGHIPNQGKSES